MNIAALEQSWRIVLVVLPQNAHSLRLTLDDLRSKSLSSDISVLASDDPGVREVLAGLDYPVSYSLPAVLKKGAYWAAIVSSHIFEASRHVFLLAGTRVPEHWDARLVAAGQRAADAVAIAPLCVRHPILSAFESADHKPQLTVDEVDQWLNEYAQGIEFTVPVMLESCLFLQGSYWQETSLQFEYDHQLLDSLRLRGKWLLATDQVYVDDSRTICNSDVAFLPPAVTRAYSSRHPLMAERHALMELSSRAEKPLLQRHCLPVELHVGHSWGGGLSRWIENYIEADNSHNHYVLRSIGDLSAYGQQIGLYPGAGTGPPIRTWLLAEPIHSTVIGQYEYRRLLQEVIEDFNVESLTISSLIGHAMDLLRTGLPTTYVLHDFFPFCPALYACYGSPCHSCKVSELEQCGSENPLHSYFKLESTQHWLEVRRAFFDAIEEHNIALVAPSISVVQRYSTLEQRMADKTIHVIEHGLASDLVDRFSAAKNALEPADQGRLRIVVLGRMTPEKGELLLAEMINELKGFADIWLLGAGKNGHQFRTMTGVTVVDEYSLQELQEYLVDIAPHMGLLLSIVPETFSYTLSEMWAAGVPVLATRLGAFGDRIRDGENGWLEPIDAASILARLKDIDNNREGLAATRERVLHQRVRTSADMVKDYLAIKPQLGFIPLGRYFLPRRTYQSPYQQPSQKRETALYIDREATYRSVLREFLQYSSQKIDQSPRLSRFLRTFLTRLLGRSARALSPPKAKK